MGKDQITLMPLMRGLQMHVSTKGKTPRWIIRHSGPVLTGILVFGVFIALLPPPQPKVTVTQTPVHPKPLMPPPKETQRESEAPSNEHLIKPSAQPIAAPTNTREALPIHNTSDLVDVGHVRAPPSLSENTELHLIGVYQGALPSGEDSRPWWAKCGDPHDQAKMLECHTKYAGQHTTRQVEVTIHDAVNPLALAFMSYEPTRWIVKNPLGVRIERVILAGNYEQSVIGIASGTPLVLHTNKPSQCDGCWQNAESFLAYQTHTQQGSVDKNYLKAVQILKKTTSKRPSTFQGRYEGGAFSISSNTPRLEYSE